MIISPFEPAPKAPRLRVGVIGCGVVAQVMHLHYLREMGSRYEVVAVCDFDDSARAFAIAMFPAAKSFERWQDLIAESLDAVLVLTSGSHAPIAIAAAARGIHVFTEKPVAFSVAEAEGIEAARRDSGVTMMVGYMKRYDPATHRTAEQLAAMEDCRMVRVTTLESPTEPYLWHYPAARRSGGDTPALAAAKLETEERLRAVVGDHADDPAMIRTYRYTLLDCLVHEFNLLRSLLGGPVEVLDASTDGRGMALTARLRFGAVECMLMWLDVPGIARYEQELFFIGDRRRVRLTFPSSMLRSMPTGLVVEGGEDEGVASWSTDHLSSFDEPFRRELVEFHEAVQSGRQPQTTIADARDDIAIAEATFASILTGDPIVVDTLSTTIG
ncbi:MAG: Gfo/Idh/MocA family oxidoreductase [Actinobacteria bacterium]|nr:Gfo/Idh/MocA family oxidoreductase [Actinomycetota bacterium]